MWRKIPAGLHGRIMKQFLPHVQPLIQYKMNFFSSTKKAWLFNFARIFLGSPWCKVQFWTPWGSQVGIDSELPGGIKGSDDVGQMHPCSLPVLAFTQWGTCSHSTMWFYPSSSSENLLFINCCTANKHIFQIQQLFHTQLPLVKNLDLV